MSEEKQEIAKPSYKIKFGNLYLKHVLAYVNGEKVESSQGLVDADEGLMRFVEWEGGIVELECDSFRRALVEQYKNYRMDLLYSKLGEVFVFMLRFESDKIANYFALYPNILL